MRGTVSHIGLDSVVVDVGGVGYRIFTTPATLATLHDDQVANLATSLVVREDALTLYGFSESDERDTFERLQTVSGVGPKLALAMLAVHAPDDLRRAVDTEDTKALRRVPGIGEKGAKRIVLELTGKLGAPVHVAQPTVGAAHVDVTEALVGLGWNAKAAQQAVERVMDSPGAPTESADILRAALQHLGGQKRD